MQQILQLVSTSSSDGSAVSKEVLTFSLKPMKRVWDEYDIRRMEIQNSAVKSANKQRLQGILSMLGVCIGLIPGMDQTLRIVIVFAALSIAIYFFIKGSVGITVQQQLHNLDEEYAKKYKCPNPACGRPFGPIPYRNIEYNRQCMACGCKYTH